MVVVGGGGGDPLPTGAAALVHLQVQLGVQVVKWLSSDDVWKEKLSRVKALGPS